MKHPAAIAVLAGAVAAGASLATVKLVRPPQQVVTVHAPAASGGLSFGEAASPLSAAKARRLAATTWPEMEQREVDALTAAAKEVGGTVVIFCHEEAKCGDLALNLDNAFESARWASEVKIFQGLPPGIMASTPKLASMLNAATGNRYEVGVDPDRNARGDYVAIGPRKGASK